MPTVSASSRPRLLVVHRVYRLYPGERECAQCLHVCTVSTDWTRVNVYVHSVYKLCTVSTNYAQCLQTMHGVYKPCTVSTCIQGVYRLSVYARLPAPGPYSNPPVQVFKPWVGAAQALVQAVPLVATAVRLLCVLAIHSGEVGRSGFSGFGAIRIRTLMPAIVITCVCSGGLGRWRVWLLMVWL